MTSERCPREYCYAPESRCIDGKGISECEHFSELESDTVNEEANELRLPWSGLAFGLEDVHAVTALSRARLIGVVGGANAGKTTALAAFFLRLRRGNQPGGWRFAGSFTLNGWNSISHHLEWDSVGPTFPPHTTSVDDRQPSLLHVALKHSATGVFRDLLISDAPGEWFTQWAFNETDSPGACWLAEHADLFVLFADSEALSGEDRGAARVRYDQLAARVAASAGERPVYPIRAKSDVEIPSRIREQVEEINKRYFSSKADDLSVLQDADGAAKLDPLEVMVEKVLQPVRVKPERTLPDDWLEDPLLACTTVE